MLSSFVSLALQRQMYAFILLLVLLSLAACQQATKPVIVTRDPPPALVVPCPPEPPRADPFFDDRELFIWISKAIEAGAECRSMHDKLSEWATHPPTAK